MEQLAFEIGRRNAGPYRAHHVIGEGDETHCSFGLFLQPAVGAAQRLAQVGHEHREQYETNNVRQELNEDPRGWDRDLNSGQVIRNRQHLEDHEVDQESVSNRRHAREDEPTAAHQSSGDCDHGQVKE